MSSADNLGFVACEFWEGSGPVWPDVGIIFFQSFHKLPKRSNSSFYLKSNAFIFSLKVVQYLGYFCSEICNQELSKIAQSGQTARKNKFDFSCFLFFKWPIPGLFFFIFRLFYKQLTVNKCSKSCRWLDSNPGPLVSETTTLPTAQQPLPCSCFFKRAIPTLIL